MSKLVSINLGGVDTGGTNSLKLNVVLTPDNEALVPLSNFNLFAGKKNSLKPFFERYAPFSVLRIYVDSILSSSQLDFLFTRLPASRKSYFLHFEVLHDIVWNLELRPALKKVLILTDEQYETLLKEFQKFSRKFFPEHKEGISPELVGPKNYHKRIQSKYELVRSNFRASENVLREMRAQVEQMSREGSSATDIHDVTYQLDMETHIYHKFGEELVKMRADFPFLTEKKIKS